MTLGGCVVCANVSLQSKQSNTNIAFESNRFIKYFSAGSFTNIDAIFNSEKLTKSLKLRKFNQRNQKNQLKSAIYSTVISSAKI